MTQTTETGASWARGRGPGGPGGPTGPGGPGGPSGPGGPGGPGLPGGPAQERLPIPTRQRRPALAAMALVLVLAGAAVSAFLVLNSGQKQSVLVLAHDVPFGHEFVASDFREGQVSLSLPGPRAVRFDEREAVVGQHQKATVPLKAGTLLTIAMINPRIQVPGTDYAAVSVAIPEGQYPTGLAAGDKVKVLYTPTSDKGVSAGGVKNGTPLPVGQTLVPVAYVDKVETSSNGQGSIVVSLIVQNQDLAEAPANGLPLVAAANAIKSLSLARLPDGTTYQTGQ
jgi:hypothetical protein